MYRDIKNILVASLVAFVVFLPYSTFAASCSVSGYTITTINGIFTDESRASSNADALVNYLGKTYRGETLNVKYLLNKTHKALDLTDVVVQKTFEGVNIGDPDFIKILNDASAQVKTQKILLVAHSQGNFYANNFYKVVTDDGDVPGQSIGVYSIATPAAYVAGTGKYLTSDTDTVINLARNVLPGTILPAFDSIDYLESDDSGRGHGFREIYLMYRPKKIIEDIKWSLDRLSVDPSRSEDTVCINPPKALATSEKITRAIVYPLDLTVATGAVALTAIKSATITTMIFAYHTAVATAIWTYNTGVVTAKFIGDTTVAVASTVYDAVTGVLSDNSVANNNIASVILAAQTTQDTPSTPPETISQPVILQTTTSEPSQALFQLAQETLPQTPSAETQALSQTSILVDIGITEENQQILLVKSTVPAQTETTSGYYSGGGGGGGSPPAPSAPVPQTDTTSPIISIIGDNPATISVNSEYVDAGATAVDDVDGAISTTSTSTVDTTILGSYFVMYTAVDVSGNIATTTRAVNIVDTSAPEITINGTNPITIEINSTYNDLGATASDAIDGARSVVTTSNVDTSRIGTYPVTYVASDLSQNISTSTREVNVVDIIEATQALFSDLNANGIADADESDVIATSTMSLTAGEYHFNNLTIANNATLTLVGDANSSSTFKGVKIVATNITIDAGSRISADAKGDTAGSGFPSSIYAGGSHGGVGLNNTATSTYGSAKQPTTLGSAGGAPHAIGGGAIRLVVSGSLVNSGVISADGNTSSSGGSIYATVADMSGSGTFHANGGALGSGGYFSGPGGGGRVAVYYQTSSFVGTIEALGGCGSYDGWSQTCAEKGTAGLFDTTNNNFSTGSSWRFQMNDGASSFNSVTLSNGSIVTMDEGITINANELQSNGASLALSNGSSITVSTFIANGGTVTFSGGETFAVNTLTLSNNATITVAQERILSLSVANLTVDAGSSISVNYKGYGQSAGPGAGSSNAGASHGGVGLWNTASSTYGSMREPTEMGSGGNGYNPRGGGAVRIIVSGSLVNNGSIVAMGDNTSSGGSIYVTTNSLSGTGEFRADGGTVYCPNSCVGAGAGGRIAVYYQTSTFSGTALASGPSTSYGKAEDGTVVVEEIVTTPPPPPLSSARAINTFLFLIGTSTVSGIVDETAHTVSITVPFGTDVSALSPLVAVSSLATSSPASAVVQDFTNPVIYTVTAEDGSTQEYTATVIIASDTVAPTITTYTFNETAGDITIDFATTTSVSFSLTASENVDWVSIKIEDQNTPDNYKIFFSSVGCVDGTATCAKSWDGALSSGGMTAPNGTYRIKAHIRDMAGNIYQEYLLPYIITVNTTLP